MSKGLRNRIGGLYFLGWIGTTALLIFGSHLGMALHVVLPWLGLSLVLLFPRDFTLFKTLSSFPVGLTFGWLIMSPAHVGSPAYVTFLGREDRLLWMGLLLGGLYTVIAVASALTPEVKLSFVLHAMLLLAMAMLYGYVALKEVDVAFDRSPGMLYRSKVLDKDRFRAYGSPSSPPIEPWGPVGSNAHATIPYFQPVPKKGDPVCMMLKQGALGVPWYIASGCSEEPLRANLSQPLASSPEQSEILKREPY